ncbi:MAG: Hsp20/alpha crystallin family protein [Candidatus Woesebacteria bacterium]|jgi:HSP20 family protein
MSLIKLNPVLSSLNRWPDFWDEDFPSLNTSASNNLDVYETNDEVIVKANVAGVPSDKIDVTYEKGVLWIKAEKVEETDDKDKKHYSKSSWNYSYRVAVPGVLNHNIEPEAEVDNGVITVTFKKAAEAKPKKLSVKSKK